LPGTGGSTSELTAFVDTNVLVRHLTNDPPEMGERATRYLRDATQLILSDVVLAEVAYVLESYYERPRPEVAAALRAIVDFPAIRTIDADLLHRTIEVYELVRLHFAEAYLVACAERTGVGVVASFDRAIGRAGTVRRVEPA
jgi:predicted nucleic acid-binding protein